MAYGQLHAWMRDNACGSGFVCRMDSVLGMRAAVRAGTGLAALPCYLAETDGKLQRIGGVIEPLTVDLWLLTHPDLRHTARIRAVLDYSGNRKRARVRALGIS